MIRARGTLVASRDERMLRRATVVLVAALSLLLPALIVRQAYSLLIHRHATNVALSTEVKK